MDESVQFEAPCLWESVMHSRKQYSFLLFLSCLWAFLLLIFTSIYYVLEYVLGVMAALVDIIDLPCEVYDMVREADKNQITNRILVKLCPRWLRRSSVQRETITVIFHLAESTKKKMFPKAWLLGRRWSVSSNYLGKGQGRELWVQETAVTKSLCRQNHTYKAAQRAWGCAWTWGQKM